MQKVKKVIHHLRKQPDDVKRQVLHLTMLVCGVILLSLWVYRLGFSVSGNETKAESAESLKPFSVLKDNLSDGYDSLSE